MSLTPLFNTYPDNELMPVRALGSKVWDQAGRSYIDLAGGIAVCAMGHSHPQLISCLEEQAHKFWHLSNFYTADSTLNLARELTRATFADRVFFTNSGAEAVETAIKLARRYHYSRGSVDRTHVLCFTGAFHGRTMLCLALGDKQAHREGFGPFPSDIERLPFNDIQALQQGIDSRLAAVLIEPVQGENGVVAAQPAFLEALRQACTDCGALLIFDEVQSGNGRTGELFAYMNSGIEPDILVTAKGLANGLPIGAVMAREQVAACMTPGSHGSTFGGNPLACAVALRNLELIQSSAVRRNVAARSLQIAQQFKRMNSGVFSHLNLSGLWAGYVLSDAFRGRVGELVTLCQEQGVLVLPAGDGQVLRLAPALNITEQDLAQGLQAVEAACRQWDL
ncbi:MAG: aspartate aminotransferase family protein [Gammaproteobacteria bacterium]